MKKRIFLFIFYLILVISLTNFIAVMYNILIIHDHYSFEIVTCLFTPLVVGVVTGFFLFFHNSKKKLNISDNKKDNSSKSKIINTTNDDE